MNSRPADTSYVHPLPEQTLNVELELKSYDQLWTVYGVYSTKYGLCLLAMNEYRNDTKIVNFKRSMNSPWSTVNQMNDWKDRLNSVPSACWQSQNVYPKAPSSDYYNRFSQETAASRKL